MTILGSLMNLGGPDMIVILLIILVLFGAKRLPDLAKGMGQAMKEFHKAKDEFGHELTGPSATARTDGLNPGTTVPLSPDSLAATTPHASTVGPRGVG